MIRRLLNHMEGRLYTLNERLTPKELKEKLPKEEEVYNYQGSILVNEERTNKTLTDLLNQLEPKLSKESFISHEVYKGLDQEKHYFFIRTDNMGAEINYLI
jgi:hypothetical protein